jgi:hypothetical protein
MKYKVGDSKGVYTVDKAFILAGHEEADSEWKKKLEEKFPEVFIKVTAREAVDKLGSDVIFPGERLSIQTVNDIEYIILPLPNANTDWTFNAFDYIKLFVAANPESFPIHADRIPKEIRKEDALFIKYYSTR